MKPKNKTSGREVTVILEDICMKLDRLAGILLVQGGKLDEDVQIKTLYELRLAPSVIGSIMGKSSGAVMTRMSRVRSKKAPSKP